MENEHTKFSTHSYRNTTKKFSYFFVFDFIYKIFISLHLRHSIIWPLTTIFNVGQKYRYRSIVYIRFKDRYSIKSWASQVWLMVKNPLANAGDIRDTGSNCSSSRSSGHGNPLQHSCLENPMDRGAWRATVHGVAKSRT